MRLPLLLPFLGLMIACGSGRAQLPRASPARRASEAVRAPSAPPPSETISDDLPLLVPVTSRSNAQSALGTNLSEFRDWSSEWSTIDVFKQSRPWISGTSAAWETDAPLDLDARGWVRSLRPGQIARTLLLWDGPRYPAGDYVVLYDGEGELEYFQNTEIVSRSQGRDVIHLDPEKGGLGIFITRTNARDYLRNIRVLAPGGACSNDPTLSCTHARECAPGRCLSFERHYQRLLFHPVFLRSLAAYSSVRFMNWMATNDSEQERFEQRPKPEDSRWTVKGVPLEIMVELANRIGLDPWFCMPHRANDDYVRSFASYVRDHLDPRLRAYVEHSNEVWNGIFTQHDYAALRGAELALPRERDRFAQQMRWHARRSTEIFALWGGVYGSESARLVRVMGSWADVPYVSELLLTSFAAHQVTDALAIAPYFGHEPPAATASLEQVFASYLPQQLELARRRIQEAAEIARKYGVRLIAYEAGQHLVAPDRDSEDPRLGRLLDAVNRDPRMQMVYERYFDAWRNAGGQMLVHYVNVEGYGRHGRWGAREHMLQPVTEAPKWSAILAWSSRNPRWW